MTVSNLPPTTIPRPRTDLEEELIGDELFIRDLSANASVHCLNSGAAIIWYLCDGSRDLNEIVAEIAATAPNRTEAEILEDVQQTITRFRQLHLLESD